MKKDDLNKRRHELLLRLEDSLKEDLIPAMTGEPDEETGIEILNVIFDDMGFDGEEVLGEFFFTPVTSDEDTVQHFSAVLTLRDEIGEEHLPELFEAMSYVNFSLPCGCYCVDGEKQFLTYKLTVPISTEASDEVLFEEMNVCMGNALASADLYMDLLIKILDGQATVSHILESLGAS
ncbi:MAG: hypothetical protein K5770_09140 [Lachnospiraceae bacterium]|nr:hypothetical protein [Lachnospiraceae bacterium]